MKVAFLGLGRMGRAKDIRLMTQAGKRPLPAVTALFDDLENARRFGHGDDDFSVVAGGW